MKWKWLALLLAALSSTSAIAIDRDAFTFTRYHLDAQIDLASHVIAVTGQVSLRNDSKTSQKNICLQVSSSMAWNGVALQGKPVEWIGNKYTTDIDHTGAVSEAIATLPMTVPPGTSVVLDIQYGGTITPDATRLTRMGAPDDVALRNDWDEISPAFTAVRGLGHVVWYPVSVPAVSMSEGSTVFAAIDTWNARHNATTFDVDLHLQSDDAKLCIAGPGTSSACGDLTQAADVRTNEPTNEIINHIGLSGLALTVPSFAVARYERLTRPGLELFYDGGSASVARDYAVAAEANGSVLDDWLSPSDKPTVLVELTNPNATPYQDGAFLFTPFRHADDSTLISLMMPAQVAGRFRSPRGWIDAGLQRFLQAVALERRSGRKSAIQFLDEYLQPLRQTEEPEDRASSSQGAKKNASDDSLLSTSDQILLRGKGAFVFWMLRDMLGDGPLQQALAAYRPDRDSNPVYFQGLLETSGKRDLEWFFDDWVYRDRGLPNFAVGSVYPRTILGDPNHMSLVTLTIENKGGAGAEVPVVVQTSMGEKTVRILAPAHEKVTARAEIPGTPTKVVVNDGSVPSLSASELTYDVPGPQP